MRTAIVALLLAVVSIFGMGLAGASPASVATDQAASGATATITVKAIPATDLGVQSNCPITSYHLHAGAYICETVWVRVAWYLEGVLILVDDVVIGTDYRIYHDSGPGWIWLNGGVASSTANAPGIGIVSNNTIDVIGTDNQLWCITTTFPGNWSGWSRC
jgi:hypothetical protein